MKKKDNLESFMNENRDKFDFVDLPTDMFKAIETKLPKQKSKKRSNQWIAYAASLLILFSFYWMYKADTGSLSETQVQNLAFENKNIDPAMVELIEAESYYKSKIATQFDSLHRLISNQPELTLALDDMMNELDENYLNMTLDLQENMDKQVVMSAMINHQRLKLQTINEMIDYIKTSNL